MRIIKWNTLIVQILQNGIICELDGDTTTIKHRLFELHNPFKIKQEIEVTISSVNEMGEDKLVERGVELYGVINAYALSGLVLQSKVEETVADVIKSFFMYEQIGVIASTKNIKEDDFNIKDIVRINTIFK